MPRAKAGDNIADIERDAHEAHEAAGGDDIRPCPCCGRNFAAGRLEVHLEICQKITVNSQQRQTWSRRCSCTTRMCCVERFQKVQPLGGRHTG